MKQASEQYGLVSRGDAHSSDIIGFIKRYMAGSERPYPEVFQMAENHSDGEKAEGTILLR